MYKQSIDMNDMLRKGFVESSRQDQTQLDSTSESGKIVFSSQFLFGVHSIVNYTGELYIVFTLPFFGAGAHDIHVTPGITLEFFSSECHARIASH